MALIDISYGKLTFDDAKEADIANFVNGLKSSHKIGEFLSNIIRLACDCPEIMGRDNIERLTSGYNMTNDRKKFFNEVTKEVSDMQEKIDKMYYMILSMYMLSQMGKTLGLEEKANNALMAQFIVEKQFKELKDLIGESMDGNVLASNKIQNTQKIAEDALQLIIESYSGIVGELKQCQSVQYIESKPIANDVVNITDNTNSVKVDNNVENNSTQESTSDNEYIDFGDADMSALQNFFGE